MYLLEIVVEGFKSYAEKTVIGPFDPTFNAISGFNGTGKSNILDAICFVMAIKSLSQMRVNKADELIYKQGQGGIAKASVTLVFRNSDRNYSPLGYQDHPKITVSRQIAIGGRDHFLINGHTAKAVHVQNLFLSVQLNVNTAYFLVMQGKITKMINMKPLELLGVIEEAAGTKFYESKRVDSMKRIEQKENKLAEIQKMIDTEILPNLESLRKEQEIHVNSLRLGKQVEDLIRQCSAVSLFQRQVSIVKLRDEFTEATAAQRQAEQDALQAKAALQELTTAGPMENPEDQQQLNSLAKKLQEIHGEIKIKQVELSESHSTQEKMKAAVKQLEQQLQTADKEQKKFLKATEGQRNNETRITESLAAIEQEISAVQSTLQELRTGIAVDEGGSLRQRLAAAQEKSRALNQEASELSLVVEHLEGEVEKLRNNGELAEWRENIKRLQEQQKATQEALMDLDVAPEELKRCEQTRRELESQLLQLEEQIAMLEGRTRVVHRFHQEIADAGPNHSVRGLAVEVIRVKQNCRHFTLALEEAAKAKLLAIIVTDDQIAKEVIERYKSIRRVMCIPMNRIRAGGISTQQIENTRHKLQAGADEILRPLEALDLLSGEYDNSISFVFGAAHICRTQLLAQRVSSEINGIAITPEGDNFNPHGSVTGGSSAGLGGLLADFERLLVARTDEKRLRGEFGKACQASGAAKVRVDKYTEMVAEAQSLQVALEAFQRRVANAEKNAKTATLTKEHFSKAQRLEEIRSVLLPAVEDEEIPKLQSQVQALKGSREEQMAALEGRLRELKKGKEETELKLQSVIKENRSQNEQNAVLLEIAIRTKEELEILLNNKIPEAEMQEQQIKMEVSKIQSALEVITKEHEIATEKFGTSEKNKRAAAAEQIEIKNQIAEYQKIAHAEMLRARSARQRLQDDETVRANILRADPWLAELEQNNFEGIDVKSKDAQKCYEKRDDAKAELEKIQRAATQSIGPVLLEAEKQLKDLMEKKIQLERDRRQLQKFIKELGEKRRDVMQQCFLQVDQNLSTIFSILLPSSDARLKVVDDREDLSAGLELQVTVSSTTKDSNLEELSGGQRSLLALAIILAVLKYKPAPLYILDEVDAALDLSHTQRIGKMIKEQFRGSQFIIVSLKENLFNYADVLFKTSFTGGSSRITRITNTTETTTTGNENENPRARKFRSK